MKTSDSVDAFPSTRTSPKAAREVTRHISRTISEVLWGKSAGRCQFCNLPLWKSPFTQERVKHAERAHIYSFSEDGPRGNDGVADDDLNSLPNLMLVCHPCHKKFDQRKDGGRYSVDLLRQIKEAHEKRVELVTGIVSNIHSHILLYGANIGDHASPLQFNDAASALFPELLPAIDQPIELSLLNSAATERDHTYWSLESSHLRRLFERRVRERIGTQTDPVSQLSVFAIAPQPLLILLGCLLGDIVPARVYQRRREPATWTWSSSVETLDLQVRQPTRHEGAPALVLGLSATITDDRIVRVLGPDTPIWRIEVPQPHNDILQSEAQLRQWRELLRPVFDQIKARHGQTATLHIFPAIPVAAAVELGRVRMPKADMPWRIYDQVNALGGFVPALSIPETE